MREQTYAVYHLAFGCFRIAEADGAVVSISTLPKETEDTGTRTALSDFAAEQLSEYFSGTRKTFSFPYRLSGTEFQKKVWAALTEIPYGETRSYRDIADAVGNPKACRAVGMANHRNPMMIVVPCHRVIGKNGSLVGYGGGMELKTALLSLEKNVKETE